MPGGSFRLFVALPLSEPAAHSLRDVQSHCEGVEWTPPERLHLTLRFIGQVSTEAKDKIEEVLSQVEVRRFFLDLAAVGGFPTRTPPSVLWVGVGKGHPLLHQLRQQVDDLLLNCGIRLELHPFVPHVTVGRVLQATPVAVNHWLKRHRDFVGPMWPVDSVSLMSSERDASDLDYRVLRQFSLN